jgi:hypothetical protein
MKFARCALHAFTNGPDGGYPRADLIFGIDGNLYFS